MEKKKLSKVKITVGLDYDIEVPLEVLEDKEGNLYCPECKKSLDKGCGFQIISGTHYVDDVGFYDPKTKKMDSSNSAECMTTTVFNCKGTLD